MLNNTWGRLSGSLVVLMLGLIGACGVNPPQEAPDQILINGKILTVDENFSIVEAIAISGEKIVAGANLFRRT